MRADPTAGPKSANKIDMSHHLLFRQKIFCSILINAQDWDMTGGSLRMCWLMIWQTRKHGCDSADCLQSALLPLLVIAEPFSMELNSVRPLHHVCSLQLQNLITHTNDSANTYKLVSYWLQTIIREVQSEKSTVKNADEQAVYHLWQLRVGFVLWSRGSASVTLMPKGIHQIFPSWRKSSPCTAQAALQKIWRLCIPNLFVILRKHVKASVHNAKWLLIIFSPSKSLK